VDGRRRAGRSAYSNGNNDSATCAVSDLSSAFVGFKNSEQSKTAAPQNIETFIEFLPRPRRWGWGWSHGSDVNRRNRVPFSPALTAVKSRESRLGSSFAN
jgi:hypothetical protein